MRVHYPATIPGERRGQAISPVTTHQLECPGRGRRRIPRKTGGVLSNAKKEKFTWKSRCSQITLNNTPPHTVGLFPQLVDRGTGLAHALDKVVQRAADAKIELLGADDGCSRRCSRG